MGYELIQGDLFTADVDAIAHGCNCRGRMGAGIAHLFRKKWPTMYEEYRKLCENRLFSLGSVFPWLATSSNFNTVYNLGTQVQPGANANVLGVRLAFTNMADVMWKMGDHSIAIPLIGCGIGGLSWTEDVEPLVLRILAHRVDVQVYYLDSKDLN